MTDFDLFDRVLSSRATLVIGHNAEMAASLRRWTAARNIMLMAYGCEDGSGTELRCSLMRLASISIIEPAASRFAVNHGRVDWIRGGTIGVSSCDGPGRCLACTVHQAIVDALFHDRPLPTSVWVSHTDEVASRFDIAIAQASVSRWIGKLVRALFEAARRAP